MNPLVVVTNESAGGTAEEAVAAALSVLSAQTDVRREVCAEPGDLDGVLDGLGDGEILVVAGGDGSVHTAVAALHRRGSAGRRPAAGAGAAGHRQRPGPHPRHPARPGGRRPRAPRRNGTRPGPGRRRRGRRRGQRGAPGHRGGGRGEGRRLQGPPRRGGVRGRQRRGRGTARRLVAARRGGRHDRARRRRGAHGRRGQRPHHRRRCRAGARRVARRRAAGRRRGHLDRPAGATRLRDVAARG